MAWRFPRAIDAGTRRLMRAWTTQRLLSNPYRNGAGGFASDAEHFAKNPSAQAQLGLLTSGVDHLEVLSSHCTMAFSSLPRFLLAEQLPWSFLAMARICAESSARLCFVIDPEVAPEQRLMRMAALMLWSNSEESKMRNSVRDSTSDEVVALNKRVDDTLRKIHDLVNRAGFDVRGPNVIDPTGRFKPVSSTISAIELMRLQLPELGEETYRRMSGFVHGAAWALGSATSPIAERLRSPAIDVLSVIWGLDTAGRSLGRMMDLYACYAGIPLGKVPARLDALYELCRAEHARSKKSRRRRLIGPAESGAWRGRFGPIVIQAWGHTPLKK